MASKRRKSVPAGRKAAPRFKPGLRKPGSATRGRSRRPKRAPALWRATIAEMLQRLPTPDGKRSDTAFTHGTMEVKLYAPRGGDPQQPHDRDEVYVVMYGSGTFDNGGQRRSFRPGDLLFVPAGIEHRFEGFTDDLVVWVVFYGPRGGEGPR